MYKQEFKARLDNAKTEEVRYKKLNERFISLRTTIFLLAVAAIGFLIFRKLYIPAVWAAAAFILVFTAVVSRHGHVKKILKRCQTLISIHENNLKRIDGGWSEFPDKGDEFLMSGHPYAADLNIFGAKSLFQLINQTHTYLGRKRLSKLLGDPEMNKDAIKSRQGAVKELAGKLDLSEELMLEGLLSSKTSKDPDNLLNTIKSPGKVPVILKSPLVLYVLPSITILSMFFAGRSFPWLYLVVLTGLILQLLMFLWSFIAVNPILSTVNQFKNELSTYQKLMEILEREELEDPYLKLLRERLVNKDTRASKEIKRISVISDYIDFKYSPVLYFVLNALILWDLQLYKALERWQRDNNEKVSMWIETLAEFEALESLSVIAMINPVWTFPEISEGMPSFVANGLGHPYINYEKRVSNEVDLKGIGIITGSNMSGKTTLLRTVGINLVLALAGAPVCASSMTTSIMSLLTSMRNQDDLNEGISTFYAELLRIKKIVDFSRNKENMLFLIDEIFKGTNSRDRIEGSKIVLKNLNKPWAVGFISTHDYELCDLETEDSLRFENLHFTETYQNGEIYFDYALHKGRCKTSNARYLMKMVGLA